MSAVMLETCGDMKWINIWGSVSGWSLANNFNEMDSQQNVKEDASGHSSHHFCSTRRFETSVTK